MSKGSHENSLDLCSGQGDSVHVISLELALFTNKVYPVSVLGLSLDSETQEFVAVCLRTK